MKVKFEDYEFQKGQKLVGYLIRNKDLINVNGIAKRAGVSPSFLKRIANSERRLTKKTFEKLLPALKALHHDF